MPYEESASSVAGQFHGLEILGYGTTKIIKKEMEKVKGRGIVIEKKIKTSCLITGPTPTNSERHKLTSSLKAC